MKRALFLFAAVSVLTGPLTARACQYCRMALEDPEGGRMVTDNRGGSFPLDGALNQYQAAPAPVDLKVAPAAASIVTSARALTVPGPTGTVAPVVVHRPVLLPPTPVVAAAKVVPVSAPASLGANAVLSHWMDACLLGLVAAGGVFCWRTRRASNPGDKDAE